MEKLGVAEPYADTVVLPEGCELAVREGEQTYLFVLNYLDECAAVELKKECVDLFTGETVSGSVELKPFEAKVLAVGK